MRSSFAAVFSRGVLEKIHDLSRVDKLIRQPRLLQAEGVRTVDDAFNERGGEKVEEPIALGKLEYSRGGKPSRGYAPASVAALLTPLRVTASRLCCGEAFKKAMGSSTFPGGGLTAQGRPRRPLSCKKARIDGWERPTSEGVHPLVLSKNDSPQTRNELLWPTEPVLLLPRP